MMAETRCALSWDSAMISSNSVIAARPAADCSSDGATQARQAGTQSIEIRADISSDHEDIRTFCGASHQLHHLGVGVDVQVGRVRDAHASSIANCGRV